MHEIFTAVHVMYLCKEEMLEGTKFCPNNKMALGKEHLWPVDITFLSTLKIKRNAKQFALALNGVFKWGFLI